MNNTQTLAELPPFYRGCVLVFGFVLFLAWVWSARALWADARRAREGRAASTADAVLMGHAQVIFWAPFVLGLCWLVGWVTA